MMPPMSHAARRDAREIALLLTFFFFKEACDAPRHVMLSYFHLISFAIVIFQFALFCFSFLLFSAASSGKRRLCRPMSTPDICALLLFPEDVRGLRPPMPSRTTRERHHNARH